MTLHKRRRRCLTATFVSLTLALLNVWLLARSWGLGDVVCLRVYDTAFTGTVSEGRFCFATLVWDQWEDNRHITAEFRLGPLSYYLYDFCTDIYTKPSLTFLNAWPANAAGVVFGTRLHPDHAYTMAHPYYYLKPVVTVVGIPGWWPLTLFGVTAFVAYFRWRSLLAQTGHCRTCGYDLRATPGRCPECGADAPPAGAPQGMRVSAPCA